MSDKKVSPREAALAVLKKAQELYSESTLAKGEWGKIHGKLKREGYSEESADKIDGAIKAKMGKSEENPDEAQDAQLGEQVEGAVHEHEKENQGAEAQEAGMKGHIKLAKFMGRMEHKKAEKEKAMQKGMAAPPAAPAPMAQGSQMPPKPAPAAPAPMMAKKEKGSK